MRIGILGKWNGGLMGLDKITTNLQTPRIEHSTICSDRSFVFHNPTFHYSIIPLLHGIRLRCFFFGSLLVELGDELRNVVDLNLLFSKFGVPEVMHAGGAFRKQNFSARLLNDLV
jgi:hypothetical protein